MLRLGEMSDLKDKVVNLKDVDSPKLFSKIKTRTDPTHQDRITTDDGNLGQSSIFYGLSSMHSDSLPFIGIERQSASSAVRIKKLFNNIKSICQDNMDDSESFMVTAPKVQK
jgi:hypothetical protein